MKFRVLFLGFMLLIVSVNAASARYYANPLDAMRIGISGVQPTIQGNLSDHWTANPGISGYFSVDAGLGWVETAASYSTFSGSSRNRPDYNNLLLSLAWDIPFSINPCVAIVPGLMAGRSTMKFVKTSNVDAISRHELVMGGRLGMQICLVRPVYLKASAEFLRTYASEPFDQVRYLVSIGTTLRTPRWLEGVLR